MAEQNVCESVIPAKRGRKVKYTTEEEKNIARRDAQRKFRINHLESERARHREASKKYRQELREYRALKKTLEQQ